ncbi:hypothetical protein Patl1_22951 [Pistacia atlantica]|uniref:Uncharacterized protein n=1 Tax=Pistacia atlantica TaxID=434234 RepID=A0ACC1A184_9ROSI|nr:hypothetical protein Patl1_22951 [Pistacia atlantica]
MLTQIQEFMFLKLTSLRLSLSYPFSYCKLKPKNKISQQKFRECFSGNWRRLSFNGFSNTAICHSFEEFDVQETKKIQGRILKLGFGREQVLCDKVLDIYVQSGDFDGAVKVLDDMPSTSVFSWNKLISGFIAKKLSDGVLGVFSQMINKNVKPNEATFASVLRACSDGRNAAFEYVKQVHAMIIYNGFGSNTLVCNRLIDLYAKNGFVDSAKKVFDNLVLKDSVSWVAMISGFSQTGHEQEAIHLFCQMHILGILPTPYALSSALSACTKLGLYGKGEIFHALVFKWGFSSETYVCNALVTLYSRAGNFISAEQVFSKMQHRDSVSYNSLISGLAQRGFSG